MTLVTLQYSQILLSVCTHDVHLFILKIIAIDHTSEEEALARLGVKLICHILHRLQYPSCIVPMEELVDILLL